MTMQELYQLCDLKKEIRMDAMRLAELEASATHITAAPSMLPSIGGDGKKLEREAAAIADLRQLIVEKHARCQSELLRLERFIQSIPDSQTRRIFVLRFCYGLSWQQVANRIGNNTRDSVRMIARRYILERQGTPSPRGLTTE